MPSQSDVARLANVSFMTVSRVVNNDPRVKEETRERVLRVIREIGYYPNAAARALNRRKAMTVGLVLPRDEYVLSEPYFTQLIYHIERLLVPHGYGLLLIAGDGSAERDVTVAFRQRTVDGLIVLGSPIGDERLEAISRNRIPTVLMHASSELPWISWVDIDNEAMIGYFLNYLAELSHEVIGFIAGDLTVLDARQRLDSFRTLLERRGRRFDEHLVYRGDWSSNAGFGAYRYFASLEPRPTAVISSNDHMAIGFIKAAHEAGERIPDDVSIVGIDDIEMASFTTPALTTMRQPMSEIAAAAVDSLMTSMGRESAWEAHTVLSAEPVIRNSCGPAAGGRALPRQQNLQTPGS